MRFVILSLFPPGFLLPFPSFVSITEEIQKRRTFAIISHPDAGKTTLKEKRRAEFGHFRHPSSFAT
jgi:hypothetical protein